MGGGGRGDWRTPQAGLGGSFHAGSSRSAGTTLGTSLKTKTHQGDSVSPLLFRWIPEDVCSALRTEWASLGYGLVIDGYRLTFMAWADDKWIIPRNVTELDAMVAGLRASASREWRPSNSTSQSHPPVLSAAVCTRRARVEDGGRRPPELDRHDMLEPKSLLPHIGHLCSVRWGRRPGLVRHAEGGMEGAPCQKRPPAHQRPPGSEDARITPGRLPRADLVCGYIWMDFVELKGLKTLQLCMTRRAGGWWPGKTDGWPGYARRTARQAERLWMTTTAPCCSEATAWLW